jgi:uncharacterized membrane protein
MTDLVFALKLIHLLGAAVLFGTGLGIAFFMWMAHRTRDAAMIAGTARFVVIADFIFTASAVVAQPASGVALAWLEGYSLLESWIVAGIALYVLVGLCWLPVVAIQMRLRDLAQAAVQGRGKLDETYDRLFCIWFWFGWPAFAGVLTIFALMIWKPTLW